MSAPTTPIRQSARPAAGAGAEANGRSAIQQNQNLRNGQPMVSAIPTRLQQNTANNGSTGSGSSELTVQQLLAQSQSPANMHTRIGDDYKRETAAGSSAANNTGLASWRKGQGFKAWETELLRSAEVKRKADVAQLCKPPRNASSWL